MRDLSTDPNLEFFRSKYMELQAAMPEYQRRIEALRRRATLQGIETIGVTTTSEADERWS